jgi:hypothetical protein
MSLTRFANFMKRGPALLLLALASLSNSALFAQITTATLTGTIKDATGAVVPHAKIETTNRGTASVRSAVSDSNGGRSTLDPVKLRVQTTPAVETGRRVHDANGTWAARDVLLMGEFLAKIETGLDAAYGL